MCFYGCLGICFTVALGLEVSMLRMVRAGAVELWRLRLTAVHGAAATGMPLFSLSLGLFLTV